MKPEHYARDFKGQSQILAGDLANLTLSGTSSALASQASFLLEYWTILRKRRWIVISVLLVSVAMAGLMTSRQKPMYSAVGRIAINRESAINLGTKDSQFVLDGGDSDYTVDMETQIKVLQSDATSYQVIKALNLDVSPEFGGSPNKQMESSLQVDSAAQSGILNAFRGGLSISSVPATRILEIRYSSHNPKLAASIVNQIVKSYIEQNLRARFEATAQTTDWLTKQLADLQFKVEISQEKLVEYQREHGIVGLGEKENIVISKLGELNRALTVVEGQRMQSEAAYHMALSGSPELLQHPGVGQVDPITSLHSKEADLRTQLAAVKAQFGPNYPKARELSAQLEETENQTQTELKRALTRARAEYTQALEHEKVLSAAFEKQKQEANALSQSEIEYSLLKQNAESYRTLYDGLLQRLKEAGVAAGLKSSNIQIVDQARVPTAPYAPNMTRSLMGGLLMGCFLGVLTVFLFESLDNTVRTPEEAELISSLSALGIIPTHRASKKSQTSIPGMDNKSEHSIREIFSITRPRSEIAESYRALRTSILLASRRGPSKILLVTSAMPKDGKTTTSINIAVVLAQSGARVLLMDADLRRPSIHRALKIANETGLSTWLSGADKDRPHAIPSGIPNLDILPTGPKPPYPAELFGGAAFATMLEALRSEYDHIVIDSPPILSVTDSVLMSVLADSVLLVIRSRQTTKGALRRSLDVLHQANASVIGVVLNAFNVNGEEYAYYRYYYGYGHGAGYYNDKPPAGITETSVVAKSPDDSD
jgi:capsular exopolysaccharide synthesis family protein